MIFQLLRLRFVYFLRISEGVEFRWEGTMHVTGCAHHGVPGLPDYQDAHHLLACKNQVVS